MAENPQIEDQQHEANRLKTLAQLKFDSSKLKSALKFANKAHNLCPDLPGLSEMLTAFTILNSAKNPKKPRKILDHPFPYPDLYAILGVTPFSSLSIIKAQYKKLALILHPDKNTFKNASNEAFKLTNDAFQVFSDKGKRREYDTRLRLALIEEREESEEAEEGVEGLGETATFLSRCPNCRMKNRFERDCIGNRLVCPSCDQGFKGVEDGDKDTYSDDGNESVVVRKSGRVGVKEAVSEELVEDWEMSSLSELLRKRKVKESGNFDQKKANFGLKVKTISVNEVLVREESTGDELPIAEEIRKIKSRKSKKERAERGGSEMVEGLQVGELRVDNSRSRGKMSGVVEKEAENLKIDVRKRGRSEDVEVLKIYRRRSKNDKAEREGSETIGGSDVGELRVDDRRRSRRRMSGVVEEEADKLKNDESKRRSEDVEELERVRGENGEVVEELTLAEMQSKALKKSKGKKENENKRMTVSERVEEQVEVNTMRQMLVQSGDMEVMTVQESDFHDFDSDRVGKSFKQGQIWAIYDDDDGMPRHYGLIDEVVSAKSFEVNISWLDLQDNGDESLISWEKMGYHVSCGTFKVSKKDNVNLLNIFSHLVDCNRVARELYRIYPMKGSIWALYSEGAMDVVGSHSMSRQYDIVLFLTSYSELYGLSMVYLEKVDGYRAVFKRQEIGYNAVKWLQRIDRRLFSHQIPARKLSVDEAPDIPGECWELDPASLPQGLLALTA